MTRNVAKTRTTEDKSPVGVRRKTAEIPVFRRISVFCGLSGRRISRIGDQTP